MELIKTLTVGAGGAATIDFTAIPNKYTDLVLLLSARATSTTATITIALNGSSTSFNGRYLQGTGSGTSSTTSTTLVGNASISTDTTSTFNNLTLKIPNYAGSTNKNFYVDVVSENNASAAFQQIFAGIWSNTAAITQVTLSLANFAQYSTASLYGITKGTGGATVS